MDGCFCIKTDLLEFHKIILTVMKKCFHKYKLRMIKFQEFTHFQNNALREDLLSKLLSFNIEMNGKSFTEFF